MAGLKKVRSIKELHQQFEAIKTTTAGDVRFLAQAALFNSERIGRMEDLFERALRLVEQAEAKKVRKAKRPPTEWQRFFAKGMKAGQTPAEIAAAWRNR